jgi:N-acyl-D-amino-acid deacylase
MNTAALLLLSATLSSEPDVVLKGGSVHDGSGNAPVVADVHLNKIVAVGKVDPPAGATVIDATGLVVCPGFIDLHTHCDPAISTKSGRANKNYVTQGVTTVVTGNCGSGPVDTATFLKNVDAGGAGTNVIHQAPHNSIRAQVMGNANRAPATEELTKMEGLVDKAMADGCWGLATGLIYTPGTYAKTEEIIALAKVAAKHGGHYASHIRNEGTNLLTAIDEAIRIGEEAGCPVHISHIKASGSDAHGLSARAITAIESARKVGQVVTADQYPYVASSTSLSATVVPSRYRDGTAKDYVARWDDPTVGLKLKAAVESALRERGNGKNIQIARYARKPEWQGKRISEVAEAEKKPAIDIVVEIEKNGGASIVNFGMNEADVRTFMKQPWVATASDGSVHTPGPTVPHPRSYGTFPRKVGLYAVEEHVVSLEAAVRSCTGLPADILRMKDRGYLKPGNFADVLVFDAKTYRDTATYDKPHQYATGVTWVFVNGKAEVAGGEYKADVLGGKALRHEE